MRRFAYLFFIVAIGMPGAGLARDGLYVGLSLGGSFLSSKRTLFWDQDALADIYFAENSSQSGSGFDDQVFVGWRGRSGSLMFGGECQIGCGGQKQKFQGINPNDPDNLFKSDLSEKLHLSLLGVVGSHLGGVNLLFKLGFIGAQIQHDYQELDAGIVTDSNQNTMFSPALGVGLTLEKPLGKKFAVRLDYMCSFHKAIDASVRNGADDTTVVQKANSLRNQSVMLSLVLSLA